MSNEAVTAECVAIHPEVGRAHPVNGRARPVNGRHNTTSGNTRETPAWFTPTPVCLTAGKTPPYDGFITWLMGRTDDLSTGPAARRDPPLTPRSSTRDPSPPWVPISGRAEDRDTFRRDCLVAHVARQSQLLRVRGACAELRLRVDKPVLLPPRRQPGQIRC